MPKGYHHLTQDIRCQIYTLLESGISQKQIARKLNISQSTVTRPRKSLKYQTPIEAFYEQLA